jgi:hypothetical protein
MMIMIIIFNQMIVNSREDDGLRQTFFGTLTFVRYRYSLGKNNSKFKFALK